MSIDDLEQILLQKNLLVKPKRGYFGIGIYEPQTSDNIGTLLRSAFIFGAAFVFTVGKRYKGQKTDTLNSIKHIPLWHFADLQQLQEAMPKEAPLVFIEQSKKATSLNDFVHPERAVYLLGNESRGIPESIMSEAGDIIDIPTEGKSSLNVAVAGSVVMYDRIFRKVIK